MSSPSPVFGRYSQRGVTNPEQFLENFNFFGVGIEIGLVPFALENMRYDKKFAMVICRSKLHAT